VNVDRMIQESSQGDECKDSRGDWSHQSQSARNDDDMKKITMSSTTSVLTPGKRCGKSVGTATTASISTGTQSGTGGASVTAGSTSVTAGSTSVTAGSTSLLHSPTVTEDLNLTDPERIAKGGGGSTTKASPPVLDMDDLPKKKTGKSTSTREDRDHRGVRGRVPPTTMKSSKTRPVTRSTTQETKQDDRRLKKNLSSPSALSSASSFSSSSTSTSDDDSQILLEQRHDQERHRRSYSTKKRNSSNDPCMPMVMDDVREMVATSLAKTLFFFNQVSTFFQDYNDDSRRNTNMFGFNKPTSIIMIPTKYRRRKMRQHDQMPDVDESLLGNPPTTTTNPPLLEEDSGDDLSSLTNPPGFLIDQSCHILEKYDIPRGMKGRKMDHKNAIADRLRNGGESLFFTPENEDGKKDKDKDMLKPVPGELFDNVLLGMAPIESILPPAIYSTVDHPLIQSDPKSILPSSCQDDEMNPTKDTTPETETNQPPVPTHSLAALSPSTDEAHPPVELSTPLPVLADKISDVSTEISTTATTAMTDPRFRFPLTSFRPRSREDHRYLAAIHNEYHITHSQPPPPPRSPLTTTAPSSSPPSCSRQPRSPQLLHEKGIQKHSPTSVHVVWSYEMSKLKMSPSIHHFEGVRRTNTDLESVEC